MKEKIEEKLNYILANTSKTTQSIEELMRRLADVRTEIFILTILVVILLIKLFLK